MIILCFCRQLLLNIRGNRITGEDLAIAFNHQKVQDEIRTVINSNFQGNSLARIVFLATVLVFHGRHPLTGIRDLPSQLVQRLGPGRRCTAEFPVTVAPASGTAAMRWSRRVSIRVVWNADSIGVVVASQCAVCSSKCNAWPWLSRSAG